VALAFADRCPDPRAAAGGGYGAGYGDGALPGAERGLPDLADPAAEAADWVPAEEPGLDDEADRDPPHPSGSDHLDYLDALDTADLLDAMAILARRHGPRHDEPDTTPGAGAGAPDPFSRQALAGKLAAIRQAAYSHGPGATGAG